MEGEKQPPPAVDSVSKVLDDEDLLVEILLRVAFPNTLVRAALVCKRWLGHASEPAFLRRFRELHPPRLLGFYINNNGYGHPPPPSFVPMLPQPAELAAIVRRTNFNAYRRLSTGTLDCRNGSVFIALYNDKRTLGVHRPLCRGERGLTILSSVPRPQLPFGTCCTFSQVVSKEGDGLSYYYLYVESTMGESRLHVYMMQDGSWHMHHLLDIGQLLRPRSKPKAVLVDNKIYMAAGPTNIVVLDLKTLSFSTVQLPQGVEHGSRGTTMLSRAGDASGVYLIHVKEFQLRIWLRKEDNWLLVDSICLHEMCANLRKSDSTIKNGHNVLLMDQVVDYGDFVFLQMGGCVLHLDVRCRTLRKVYEYRSTHLGDIHPFTMIWPPAFPTVKYDPARFVFWYFDDLVENCNLKKKDTRKLMDCTYVVNDMGGIKVGISSHLLASKSYDSTAWLLNKFGEAQL
ncbi:hypothetical protein CFC21_079154 [Triticum aestivum]|uniref:F-box protein AT5G49610-like beta-propeller domain-containing protein n=2 Tax=Triticum aestivum TaxID=4565 RepID=A0A9R1HZ51_WHEAT|nr:hypothetical protein CFC21_079150 [Triticum aestivum]KAF7074256.1 hypothetical protein CFC21_079154 [Triticum aestivum]